MSVSCFLVIEYDSDSRCSIGEVIGTSVCYGGVAQTGREREVEVLDLSGSFRSLAEWCETTGGCRVMSGRTMPTPRIGLPPAPKRTGTSSLDGGMNAADAYDAQRENTREVFVNIIGL